MIITDIAPDRWLRHDTGSALNSFRARVYRCFTRRPDVLFQLADAITCSVTRVSDIARLSLEPEQQRGHGGVYDGLNAGRIDHDRFTRALAGTPVPTIAGPDGRRGIVLAVDVSNWLRPGAATSPGRAFCHTYARGRGPADMIPGWPYSFIVALESGPASWTAILNFCRLSPDDDATQVSADQLRGVIADLAWAGHWRPGDPDILIVADAGYDLARLTHLTCDLPVVICGRVRSGRVFHSPAGTHPGRGRPARHGTRFALNDPTSHHDPIWVTSNDTSRYGRPPPALGHGCTQKSVPAATGPT